MQNDPAARPSLAPRTTPVGGPGGDAEEGQARSPLATLRGSGSRNWLANVVACLFCAKVVCIILFELS